VPQCTSDEPCHPNKCNTQTYQCESSCRGNDGCAPPYICNSFQCKLPQSNGASCASSEECESGFCCESSTSDTKTCAADCMGIMLPLPDDTTCRTQADCAGDYAARWRIRRRKGVRSRPACSARTAQPA
ncbi:MAG TPA: hypothetical protein VM686_23465, partial [Polyangiaceae bacterium]|nr:hypothetical protein [Polyangiaceae bacterium]